MGKTLKIKKAEPTIAAKPVVPGAPDGAAPAAPDAAAPADGAAPAQPSGGIYVSSRHKIENAVPGGGAAVARAPSFGWAAVLSAIATIIFLIVVILEFSDWDALKLA